MTAILFVSVIIVVIVLLLAVITTSKAYGFKHTVDPITPIDEKSEVNDKKEA